MLAEQHKSHGFSCGYCERFSPFLLDEKPFLLPVYRNLFEGALGTGRLGRVLDIGCGTGLYWPILVDRADTIAGIDNSEAMISAANKLISTKHYNSVTATLSTGEELPFPDQFFDTIIALDVLHHVVDPDRTLSEIKRVLKPGGRLLASEPNMLNPLMLLAHLLPPEERLACVRNWPMLLRRRITRKIGSAELKYLNYVASASDAATAQKIESIDRWFSKTPLLRAFSLRFNVVAKS